METVPDASQRAIAELSRMLLREEQLVDAVRRVAELAVLIIPACDSCSVTVLDEDGRKATTRVATSDVAQRVDDEQYRVDDGPCLRATRTGEHIKVDVAGGDDRWPEFTARAAAQGVRSSSSVPLSVDGTVVGALNLYSESGPFEAHDDRIARDLAGQAAVTLANAAAFERMFRLIGNLQEAIVSRDLIGQAKGIIMERQRCTADDAFNVLRQTSQRRNVKLRDLAQEIVDTGHW